MNLLRDISNIVLYSLFLLDAAYAFVIHNNKGIGLVKSIKKTSSEKDLHALTLNRSPELKPIKPIKYIEAIEYLDDGEVAWEIPVKIFQSDETSRSDVDTRSDIDVEYNTNPGYSILSGVVKGLNKEIFRLDTVYDILVTWKTQTYFSNILLLFFATLLKYTNSLIIQGEVNAIKKSYNETKNVEYIEKYIKIRRYTSTVLILTAFILTKNVQNAE
jgi:hypothetical protein